MSGSERDEEERKRQEEAESEQAGEKQEQRDDEQKKETEQKQEQEKQNRRARSLVVRGLVLAVGLALVLTLLIDWKAFRYVGDEAGTIDAQTRGDPLTIESRVAGLVTAVPVNDYEAVRRGQVLYVIEQDTYVALRDAAKAATEAAFARVAVLEARIAAQRAMVATTDAETDVERATLYGSSRELGRQAALLGTAGELHRSWEQAEASDTSDRSRVAASIAASQRARAELTVLEAELKSVESSVAQRDALTENTNITLGYTKVLAPEDGVVSNRLVYLGQFVAPGMPLIHFVSLRDVWAVGFFREEELTHMQPGQPARIHVDAYPNYEMTGRVDSIGPIAQAERTTLPPDRATGNFTKVVQRIPVKVVFDPTWLDPHPEPNGPVSLYGRLIPGLSVEMRILTSAHPGDGGGSGGGTGAGDINPATGAMPPPGTAPAPPAGPLLPERAPPDTAPLALPGNPSTTQPGRPGSGLDRTPPAGPVGAPPRDPGPPHVAPPRTTGPSTDTHEPPGRERR